MEKTIYNKQYAQFFEWVNLHWPIKKKERTIVCSFLKEQKIKKILDFGCNTGFYASEVKKNTGAEVYGTDINEYALDVGRKKYPEIKFLSLEKAASMKNYFDAIILIHVLEHVPDCSQTLSLLKSLLAKNGKIIINVPQERIRGDCNIPYIILSSLQNKRYTNHHLHVLKFEDVDRLLSKLDLKIENSVYVNFLPPFVTKRYIWPISASLVAVCRRN